MLHASHSRRRWVTPSQHILLERYICMYRDSIDTKQLPAFWDFFFIVWFSQFPSRHNLEMKLVDYFSKSKSLSLPIFNFRTSKVGSCGGAGDLTLGSDMGIFQGFIDRDGD
jgi:hypothetical protein